MKKQKSLKGTKGTLLEKFVPSPDVAYSFLFKHSDWLNTPSKMASLYTV
jgi:hypothetical protein